MDEDARPDDFVPGGHSGLDVLAAAHANMYQSRLLNSIDECLKEDEAKAAVLPHSNSNSSSNHSTDNFNISMLFDEPNTGFSPAFNIRNCSQDTLSGFDSSFFASQDISALRCAGDITVSDFGNSRYGLALHGSSMPPWTTHSADSMASVDTLPEYIPRSELPPPYPFMVLTPQAVVADSTYDLRRMNRSRANMCLSAHPSTQWSRSFTGHSDSIGVMRNPSMTGSRAFMDSYDP
ncbi:hypothetical protein GGF43_006830, partial [Coemansia sp. RSA 2618]